MNFHAEILGDQIDRVVEPVLPQLMEKWRGLMQVKKVRRDSLMFLIKNLRDMYN